MFDLFWNIVDLMEAFVIIVTGLGLYAKVIYPYLFDKCFTERIHPINLSIEELKLFVFLELGASDDMILSTYGKVKEHGGNGLLDYKMRERGLIK
jgi:hypothetical protein